MAMDTTNPRASGLQLLVLHPHQLEDAETLIEAVKRNQTVVLNASSADAGQVTHRGPQDVSELSHRPPPWRGKTVLAVARDRYAHCLPG
jgi:hypothetical protein